MNDINKSLQNVRSKLIMRRSMYPIPAREGIKRLIIDNMFEKSDFALLETVRLINDSSAYDAVRATWTTDFQLFHPLEVVYVKALDSVGFKLSDDRIGDMIIKELYSVEQAAKKNTKFQPVEQYVRGEEFLQRIVDATKSMYIDALNPIAAELFSNACYRREAVEKNLELLKLADRLADTHVNKSYLQLRYEASIEEYRNAIDLHEQVVSALNHIRRPLDADDDEETLADRIESIFAV